MLGWNVNNREIVLRYYTIVLDCRRFMQHCLRCFVKLKENNTYTQRKQYLCNIYGGMMRTMNPELISCYSNENPKASMDCLDGERKLSGNFKCFIGATVFKNSSLSPRKTSLKSCFHHSFHDCCTLKHCSSKQCMHPLCSRLDFGFFLICR